MPLFMSDPAPLFAIELAPFLAQSVVRSFLCGPMFMYLGRSPSLLVRRRKQDPRQGRNGVAERLSQARPTTDAEIEQRKGSSARWLLFFLPCLWEEKKVAVSVDSG